MLLCNMYPIDGYHLYFSLADARADAHSLYYTVSYSPGVSLAKLLIEKGESKYSTDSNEIFVLTEFMLKCLPSVGRVMLCFVGCMFLVDSSFAQLFVSSNLVF